MYWDKKLCDNGILWRYSGSGAHAALSLTEKHSDLYFNTDYLVSNTALLKEACSALFTVCTRVTKQRPDWIITYPTAGLNIGFCLADLFEAKFGYIKSTQEPKLQFNLKPHQTALLCADDLITGSSMRKVINAIAAKAVKTTGPIAVLVNLSNQPVFAGIDVVSLVCTKMNLWDPNNCPLCASGSVAVSARDNWQELVDTKI